jgi:hypothetical protein
MDVLTDLLNALELKGWISARRELTPLLGYRWFIPHEQACANGMRFVLV